MNSVSSLPTTNLSIVASFLDDRDRARAVSVCRCFHEAVATQLWNELSQHPLCGYIVKHSSVAELRQGSAVNKIRSLSAILIVAYEYRRFHPYYRFEIFSFYLDKMNPSRLFIYANKQNDEGFLKSPPIRMLNQRAINFGLNDAIKKQNFPKAKSFFHHFKGNAYSYFNSAYSNGFFELATFFLKNKKFDASAVLLVVIPGDEYKNLVHTIFKTGNFTSEGFTSAIANCLNFNQVEGLDLFISYPWQTPEQLQHIRDLAIYQQIRFDANRFFPERVETTYGCCFLSSTIKDINSEHWKEYVRSNTPNSLNNRTFNLRVANQTALIAQLNQEITTRFPII